MAGPSPLRWTLNRAQGYRGVYILFGGLDAWNDDVLHPLAPADSTPAALAAFQRAAALARSFGGSPQRAVPGGTTTLALEPAPAAASPPPVAAPKLSATLPAGTAPKKKEGC
jgi:hypothetical protein